MPNAANDSSTSHHVHALDARGFHRVVYRQWGDPENPRVLICVHGLTRNSRDFDSFAASLADSYRVLCPDVVGRGASDWLDEGTEYGYPLYVSDMAALIARSGAKTVDWVGTSMGGLIGMMLAARAGAPMDKLVLNDIGPFLPKAPIERIASYAGLDPRFSNIQQVERYYRRTYTGFGELTDQQWRMLAEYGSQSRANGGLGLAYDPLIAAPLTRKPIEDQSLWPLWEKIRCRTLVVRGAESDLLLPDTVERMRETGPKADALEFAGVGHAPLLLTQEQIEPIKAWLLAK